jgi:hypothetical protein
MVPAPMTARTKDGRLRGRAVTVLLPLLFVLLLGSILGPSVVAASAQPRHDLAWIHDRDCAELEESLDSGPPSASTREPAPGPIAKLRPAAPRVGKLAEALASTFLRRAPPSPLGVL